MKENKFYVYCHYDENDIPRYVGKGYKKGHSYARAYMFRQRNADWHEMFKKKPYKVRILEENILKEHIDEAENNWIKNFGMIIHGEGTLVNKVYNLSYIEKKEKARMYYQKRMQDPIIREKSRQSWIRSRLQNKNNPDVKRRLSESRKKWYDRIGKDHRKEYRQLNKEKINEYKRAHYAENKDVREKNKKYARLWREKHPEKMKVYSKKQHEKRRALGMKRSYTEEQKERIRELSRIWRENNKERMREYRIQHTKELNEKRRIRYLCKKENKMAS